MLPKFKSTRSRVLFKRKKRDYHVKSLKNPFYFKTDKTSLKQRFNALLIIIIFLALVYFIGFTNFFKIQNIEVTGGAGITRNLVYELTMEQQNDRAWLIFKQDKLPFFSTKDLIKRIKRQIILDTIKVEKDWRNGLKIQISERFSDFYLLNQGQVFTLDGYGNLISVLEALPTTTTLPVINFNNRNLVIGEQLADSDYLSEVKTLYNFWQEGKIEPAIQYVEVDDNWQSELKVRTQKGFDIFLSRNYDLASQLNSYKKLYEEKINQEPNVSYVDLRVEGWIYYK